MARREGGATAVADALTLGPRKQTRARYPDAEGFVDRDGVRLFYESYGSGDHSLLLVPTWNIIHSRSWKMQVPYLARHLRVVTFDPRGNGRSDSPATGYTLDDHFLDALAVLDATGLDRTAVGSFSQGCNPAAMLAALHPERVERLALIAPAILASKSLKDDFWTERESYAGWEKYSAPYWLSEYEDFLAFFFGQIFSEPHSTKPIEDCCGWGLETTGEILVQGAREYDRSAMRRLLAEIHCPTLVLHGDEDRIIPLSAGAEVSEAVPDSRLVVFEGSGHAPHIRDPVQTNRVLRDFLAPAPPPARWTRGKARRKRVLYISSPIGLGHAQRDVAIARELRELVPGVEIDWLAQHPVTNVLRGEDERIHPASDDLANESHHIESESAEHDLHCFQAWRRMDEILLANFMVFDDLVREEQYDLWIGDEAWELDYYLHENPEKKGAAYVWLTDFVGWLPMADGGEHEAFLTADYNAEMIEHIARFPRVRDRAIFVGNPDDVVPDGFGPELPLIRDWTERHFDFAGYVSGFDAAAFADRERLRAELGYAPEESVCIVTVGGSGVGGHLLRRVIAAFPSRQGARPHAPHDRRRRAADRPGLAPGCPGPRGARLRAQPVPAPRRLRPGRRAGRPDDRDGADRQPPPLPLLPAPPPLRAELPRASPARPLPGGAAHGLRVVVPWRDRRGRRRGDRPRGGLPPRRGRRGHPRGGTDRRASVDA